MTKFALIIGVSKFKDPSIEKLNSCEADIRRFAAVLKNPAIGEFDKKNVLIYLNKTKAELETVIIQFFKHRKPADELLIYYTGHGFLNEHDELYLSARDTKRADVDSTGIDCQIIRKHIDNSLAGTVGIILDCCYSGAFLGAKGAGVHEIDVASRFNLAGKGSFILSSSDATELAWTENNQSVFTRYLIQGIETGDADIDQDGQISVEELFRYIYMQLHDNGYRQNPTHKVSVKEGCFLFIAKNRKFSESLPSDEKVEPIKTLLNPTGKLLFPMRLPWRAWLIASGGVLLALLMAFAAYQYGGLPAGSAPGVGTVTQLPAGTGPSAVSNMPDISGVLPGSEDHPIQSLESDRLAVEITLNDGAQYRVAQNWVGMLYGNGYEISDALMFKDNTSVPFAAIQSARFSTEKNDSDSISKVTASVVYKDGRSETKELADFGSIVGLTPSRAVEISVIDIKEINFQAEAQEKISIHTADFMLKDGSRFRAPVELLIASVDDYCFNCGRVYENYYGFKFTNGSVIPTSRIKQIKRVSENKFQVDLWNGQSTEAPVWANLTAYHITGLGEYGPFRTLLSDIQSVVFPETQPHPAKKVNKARITIRGGNTFETETQWLYSSTNRAQYYHGLRLEQSGEIDFDLISKMSIAMAAPTPTYSPSAVSTPRKVKVSFTLKSGETFEENVSGDCWLMGLGYNQSWKVDLQTISSIEFVSSDGPALKPTLVTITDAQGDTAKVNPYLLEMRYWAGAGGMQHDNGFMLASRMTIDFAKVNHAEWKDDKVTLDIINGGKMADLTVAGGLDGADFVGVSDVGLYYQIFSLVKSLSR